MRSRGHAPTWPRPQPHGHAPASLASQVTMRADLTSTWFIPKFFCHHFKSEVFCISGGVLGRGLEPTHISFQINRHIIRLNSDFRFSTQTSLKVYQ